MTPQTRASAICISICLLVLSGGFFVGNGKSGAGIVVARSEITGRGSVELRSPAYRLDRVYMSMQGPRSNQPRLRVSPISEPGETIWLTGLETNIINADSLEPGSNEFFCHSNLTLNPETIDPDRHNLSFDSPTHADWRLFTLVPGRMTMQLPEGFGLPLKSSTLLDYYTMALNQNAGTPDRSVCMQTRLTYRRSATGDEGMRPLFRRALYVYQQHTVKSDVTTYCDGRARSDDVLANGDQDWRHAAGASLVTHDAIRSHQGEFCAETSRGDQSGRTPSRFGQFSDLHPGATCCVLNASRDGIVPQFGTENTVHWMVPPGRHQYRTEVTEQFQLPFDTTAHYVTGHLHPFGKSLRLVDLETDTIVFKITARSFSDKLGVEWISELRSSDGVPIQRGGRYELIAEYDNTRDQPIDAMGILYIYALDEPSDNVREPAVAVR